MAANATIGNQRLGGHAGAPLHGTELPASGAKARLQARDADLARPDADLGGIGTPVLQVDHRLGRAHIAGNDEAARQPILDVGNHVPHAIRMSVRHVDGDVFGHQPLGRQRIDHGAVGCLDAHRDAGIQPLAPHIAHKGHRIQIETVHHVEIVVLCQPGAQPLVDHGLHVGRHHRNPERARPERHPCVAFAATRDAALAGQQQYVVVIEDIHDQPSSKPVRSRADMPCGIGTPHAKKPGATAAAR